MTIKVLSEKSGLSLTYLYDILSHKAKDGGISVNKLEQIAKALDSSVAEITQDPGFIALKGIREQVSREQLALTDAVLSLNSDDWRRRAILRMLGIDPASLRGGAETKADDD